jgi:hypothetical protein
MRKQMIDTPHMHINCVLPVAYQFRYPVRLIRYGFMSAVSTPWAYRCAPITQFELANNTRRTPCLAAAS